MSPEFSGDRFDFVLLPLSAGAKTAKRATFTWAVMDGSATYRVTVERYAWLRPMTKSSSGRVWVPSRVEIVRTEPLPPAKRISREIPKA